MTASIMWHPSFSVGDPLIDRQHQILLSICNRATQCRNADVDTATEQFHIILNELADYSRIHFATEERILRACKCSLLNEQIAEHQAYQEQFSEFLYAATCGLVDYGSLDRYLSEWWVHHILDSDMQFKEYLTQASSRQVG